MGRCYQRLTLGEREEISRMLASEVRLRAIGRSLGRNVSTISREIHKANDDRFSYRAVRAHRQSGKNANKRRVGKRRIIINFKLSRVVQAKIKLYWSPEQIAKWLRQEYVEKSMHVSAETIYSYLYILPRGALKQELIKGLRQSHKRRYRKDRKIRKGMGSMSLQDMISIEERPSEVANRSVPGHWEGDLIIGGQKEQSALGTLVERTTRTTLLVPLKGKSASVVRKAFALEMRKLPQQMRLSITYDQGREMAEHKLFTKKTQIKVYFAHPQSPWERGTNENTNGLIRQFFPKGTNFKNVSRREIKRVQHLLNGRPRKVLGFKTPYEAMQQLLR